MEDVQAEYIQVQMTFPTRESANVAAVKLIEARLAACVQVCGTIHSTYIWNGTCETSQETLLLAKTRSDLFDRFEVVVRADHPYECPQIAALPIVRTNADYLRWMQEQLN